MKKFTDLTQDQQEKAIAQCTTDLLKAICEGAIRFNDQSNNNDLQARIDKAIEIAEQKRTPWFSSDYIFKTCKEEIDAMARADAENAIYMEADEKAINGIA
jgi:hypothetical protein